MDLRGSVVEMIALVQKKKKEKNWVFWRVELKGRYLRSTY